MLTHMVLISLRDDATDDQVRELVAGLEELPGLIDAIEEYRVGRDMDLADGNADVGVIARFASPDALRAYVDHPAHQRVVTELIRPVAASSSRLQMPDD